MCRYALKNYKSHFACFECRKAFKKTPVDDYVTHKGVDSEYRKICKYFGTSKRNKIEQELGITYKEIQDMYYEDLCTCPNCGANMALMGLDFKAPKSRDKESWEVISLLYNNGFSFKGCGCYVGYFPPKKVKDVEEWLIAHKRQSEAEKLLDLFKQRTA